MIKRIFLVSLLAVGASVGCLGASEEAPDGTAGTGEAVGTAGTGEKAQISYMPNIHGAFRARWEEDLETSRSRFQLRNARVTLDGRISPEIDYFLQIDACDQGTMKFLDGWGRIELFKGFKVQAGQFRMPFGVDPFKAPANYIFANRSFIGRQVCNVRAVGAKVTYQLEKLPLTLEGGAFNPTSINDHTGWQSSYAYSGRAIYRFGQMKADAGFMSLRPDGIRVNLIDGALNWTSGQWIVEGEYMYKHYTHNTHKAVHAYNLWADWHKAIKAGAFNRMSLQARFDGMTAHSNGKRNGDGVLITNDPARNRITVGATISYVRKPVWCDVRLDYEKYFYHHGVKALAGQGDRLVAELVVRF